MAIPGFSSRRPGGAPDIYTDPFERYRETRAPQPFSSQHFAPGSMARDISNGHQPTEDERAPPPLPPPRYPMDDHQPPLHSYQPREFHFKGNSLSSYNSLDNSPRDRREFRTTDRDEGYHSLMSVEYHQDAGAKTMFMSHDQFKFKPANDLDSSMLKKFDSRRALDNRSPPRRAPFSASLNDTVPRQTTLDPRGAMSLPIRQLGEGPAHPAVPRQSALTMGFAGARELTDMDRSPPHRSRRTNSGSIADDATISTQGSYENPDDTDFPMEDAGMSNSQMDYHTTGQKRRASSPLGEESSLQGLPGAGELLRRREGASRASPTPRLTIPQNSLSSLSSLGRSANSYMPSLPLTATSTTSMTGSFGRRSPGGLSPGAMSPVDGICNSPFNTPISLTHSPRSAISRIPHQRQLSESRPLSSPRKLTELPKASIPRIQGFYMCECCPKKPKKFETAEELSAHAAEKQYECSFCGNRFKNKNEAERHQNSLHVRRHSWSCSALHLAGYDKAFHESTNRPGEADACGYCGEEFLRSGGAGRARLPTEQDWDDRLRHLQEVHKFRECNSSKKFFRADHFRQHLKHSHAGTSGKWTNMLETACMIEEEPPQPR
ncbi:hypothetical protein PFICI_08830 [Pestalotiopsis fici W106-1]|uniref:C2H2-type domain-containing protein n=1 Tax=Pestalotiopsis fici (strain W106-1 / CGMCC3.15140) TaxID=1229662 RepID=W3X0S3_PESFW|nr:uncharacterized protein PFICI_08830 [Pestalotiopsis fici W106-1]ETS78977.1 hypothetical protein PFICI_08830 [Pestalotiopsis fici W106-1]